MRSFDRSDLWKRKGLFTRLSSRRLKKKGEIKMETKWFTIIDEFGRKQTVKKWDGKDKSGKYQYSQTQVSDWNMMEDEEGCILYMTHHVVPQLQIWCIPSRLTAHLRSLTKYKLVQVM